MISEKAKQQSQNTFGINSEVIIECFMKDFGPEEKLNQILVDTAFYMYCAGILHVMTPGSHLNKNWKTQ